MSGHYSNPIGFRVQGIGFRVYKPAGLSRSPFCPLKLAWPNLSTGLTYIITRYNKHTTFFEIFLGNLRETHLLSALGPVATSASKIPKPCEFLRFRV